MVKQLAGAPKSGAAGPQADQVAAENIDLRDSMAGLSRLVLPEGQQGLEDMLRHVAEFAVLAIPGADGVGLTLLEADRPDTVVATGEIVREVDAIQYSIGEGPCVTAMADGRTVISGSLSGDPAWPHFGPRVGRLGVHSALSLPLRYSREVLGALNVYARAKDAFDVRAAQLGELFSVPAAVTAQNARELVQARRLAAQLQAALASRAVIDKALGILMSRAGCGPAEARAPQAIRSRPPAGGRGSPPGARPPYWPAGRR
jgi:GAF domain/ANTAR domain